MDSPTDPPVGGATRAALIDQLRARLETAGALALAFHTQLQHGDAAAIEDSIEQLRTTADEFKVLVEELERLPAPTTDEAGDDRLVRSRAELELAVARVARTSAVTGGLLARMITISRGRLSLFSAVGDGTYAESGQAVPIEPRGVRLREWV